MPNMERLRGWLRLRDHGSRLATRFALAFVSLSVSWILCSDSYLERLNLTRVQTMEVQTAKGILFVLMVAAFLYWMTASGVRRLEEAHRREKEAVLDMALRLARAADLHDGNKDSHSERLAVCAAILARHSGLSDSRAEELRRAAMLHDIGKIGVRDSLLQKPGALDPDERREIERHVMVGVGLLEGVRHPLLLLSRVIVESHHEAWDGSGYPHGLRGEEIPIEGRIVAVCDVFDALVSERPYKQPWPIHEAIAEIRNLRGQRFDPAIVDAFDRALPEIRAVYERHPAKDSNSVGVASAALY